MKKLRGGYMSYVELITKEILLLNEKYVETSIDNYNFWEQHVKYVVKEAKELAEKYGADLEIVELGALLHDVALMANVGERKDHHINGANIAREMLNGVNYPKDRIDAVVSCVLKHRSSKNTSNIEQQCVADADILAHFDNIPMLFNSAFNRNNVKLEEIKSWLKACFEKDYNDLSEMTKIEFKDRYETICSILIVD